MRTALGGSRIVTREEEEPPLRVREFTDDVISRVHLHLCLLELR